MDNAIMMTDRDRIDHIDLELEKIKSSLSVLLSAYDNQNGYPPIECLMWMLTDAVERLSQLQPILLQIKTEK